jgi:uncharacterized phage protein gp47/JayE
MAGLTALGFERKRLPELKADIELSLQTAFGADIDLRPESFFGQLIGVFIDPLSLVLEMQENIYLAYIPDFATGVQLDGLAALSGITRLPAIRTQVIGTLYGTEGTVVPGSAALDGTPLGSSAQAGSFVFQLVEDATITHAALLDFQVQVSDLEALTNYTVTINSVAHTFHSDTTPALNEILAGLRDLILAAGFTASVVSTSIKVTSPNAMDVTLSANLVFTLIGSPGNFVAAATGAQMVAAGALNKVVSLVDGWTAVSNLVEGITGTAVETDIDFRVRRKASVSFPATATTDAIMARFTNVPEITASLVLQNNTELADLNGVPPHYIWAIVLGGTDDQVAQIIFQTLSAGIGMFGATTVTVKGANGQSFPVTFDRPTVTDVYLTASISKNSKYPSSGDADIASAVSAFVEFNYTIGDELPFTRLYTPINTIPGHEVMDLQLGLSPGSLARVSLPAVPNVVYRISTSHVTILSV